MLMTPTQVRTALRDRNLSEVARRTGVPYRTMQRYANSDVKRPDVETLQLLTDYLMAPVVPRDGAGGNDA
jgi:transcriptional regulator with XRE-family HTH domain